VPAAAGLAALEAVALIAVLLLRDKRSAVFYAALVAVKLPFCIGLLRRSAGSWLALLLWEGTGAFAAVLAPKVPGLLRLLELAMAAGVLTLLFVALPAMPRMERMELPEQ
jgi:hypothetical protein